MAGAGFPAGCALPRTTVLAAPFGPDEQPGAASKVQPHAAASAMAAPPTHRADVSVEDLVNAMGNIMHNRSARIRSVFNQCGVHFCSAGEAFLRGL
jgi:hypothetical protein